VESNTRRQQSQEEFREQTVNDRLLEPASSVQPIV